MMKKSILAAAMSVLLSTGAYAQQATVKIGLSGPFTGGSAAMGVSMRDGVKLAVQEINKAGGVLGKQIQLVERDDEAKNELGVQIAQELINKEQVVATVGFINTGVALASQRFYQEAEIPVMNNVATGTIVTRQFLAPDHKANYVFRTSANDSIQSAMIADAVKKAGYTKVAIIADSTNYGQLGKADLEKALGERGIKPVAVEKFNIGDTDMTAQALRAKDAGADVVLTYAIGPELDAAGANSEGVLMPQTFIQAPSTPKRKAFIEAYQAAYKVERIPSPVSAAQGYDSMLLLAAAINQAKSTEGKKIREALENLGTKIEGVVTTYDKPFSATDHEAITANIPVLGTVKSGRVVPANPADLEGDNALRVKPKS
jgi:branched-chain amino acid transport system substrate-binding protein